MKRGFIALFLFLPACIVVLKGGHSDVLAPTEVSATPDPDPIRAASLLERIRVLSSDEFEGRGPRRRARRRPSRTS